MSHVSSFRKTGRLRCVLFMYIDISVPLYKLSINVVFNFILAQTVITFSFNNPSVTVHPQRSAPLTVSTILYFTSINPAFYKLWSLLMSPKHVSVVPSNLHECQQGQKAGSIDIPLIITHNDNNMKLQRGHVWNILSSTSSFHFMGFFCHCQTVVWGQN